MKKLFVFCTSLVFSFAVFAESGISKNASQDDKFFTFTIEPLFGTRIGRLGEQVYSTNSKTREQYKLSELFYNYSPAFYTGLDTDFKLKKFHITLGAKYFIPMKTGILTDSDWLQHKNDSSGSTHIKTNYSEHDNILKLGLNLEAAIKYDFQPTSWLTVSPVISFLFEEMKFTGINGTAWYGKTKTGSTENASGAYFSYDDVPNRYIKDFQGNVINLRRYDYYAWIGAEALISTKDSSWDFFWGLYISPFIYTHGEDDHLYGNNPIYNLDITASILYAAKSKIFIQYNFSKHSSIKLSTSFLFTGEMKGTEYKKTSLNTSYSKRYTIIGATSTYADIQLSGVFKF